MFRNPTSGSSIFDELNRMEREMEGLFGNRGWPTGIRAAVRGSYPPINVFATAESVDVFIFSAGLDPNKLDIAIQKNLLTVAGERKIVPESNAEYYRQERYSGGFKRVITLPEDVDSEHVDARYRDGVLHINIERRAAVQPRKIEVK